MNGKLKNIIGAISAALVLVVVTVAIVRPVTISEIVGLAVAQSSTQWNSITDGARGDNLTSGVLGSNPYLYNGSAFDRLRSMPSADAQATLGIAATGIEAFNGTTYDRLRAGISADGSANTGMLNNTEYAFNGSTFDRIRSASATNNTATTSTGAIQVTPLSTWSIVNTTSASATAATASKSSGGGTVRHVATSITFCSSDTAADTIRLIHLRDGASGAGTILRTWMITKAAGAQADCYNITGLNITGSAATAMTIEFASAPAGGTQSQTVSLTGYSTP